MNTQIPVPGIRIRSASNSPIKLDGQFVLYWMVAFRRPYFNFSLQRAMELAARLQKPLIVLEALRCDYPWASDRFHAFILQGMKCNHQAFQNTRVLYYPYVETRLHSGKGLLKALSSLACVVVTDDYPCFFLPNMVRAASRICPVRLEMIDSNGIFPLRLPDKVFTTAYSFRRWMQKHLQDHLLCVPDPNPLDSGVFPHAKPLPHDIIAQWPPASPHHLNASPDFLSTLPIDHSVKPVESPGGYAAAHEKLERFLDSLETYHLTRNHPDMDSTSQLSPYLHFGFISSHEILTRLIQRESWSTTCLSRQVTGKASGFWGMGEGAEAFLEELIVWREIGFNRTFLQGNYDQYDTLPGWVRATLSTHANDPRPYEYDLNAFENATTHDSLWNAAQIQLVREGRIHNYLRMIWGKKILHWSNSPETALSIMIELNNRYALDGRDPNSYSGIFWILGRYDRAWGPERPVFGTVRYMSSRRTLQKVRVRNYLKQYKQAQKDG
ncbi:MAG: hypothetical protein WA151_02565 [Desulfatirhabdiaceae bacterium]